jgi:tetratricopeptide (TPR) repeat protein
LKLRPEIPISQFGLANALANAGQWQDVRRMTDAGRRVEPEHWMAYMMRGRLAREDGDLAAAESYFRKTLAIKQDDANSRYCLGKMLLGQHKLEKAREELRAALQYDPQHAMAQGARRAIARINESLGDETDIVDGVRNASDNEQ